MAGVQENDNDTYVPLDDKEADVLLQQLRKLLDARPKPTSGKVDGGKETAGPVAGVVSTVEVPQQKELPPSKADVSSAVAGVQQLPSSSPSSSVQPVQPASKDEPLAQHGPAAAVLAKTAFPNPLLAGPDADTAALLRERLAASISGHHLVGPHHKRYYDVAPSNGLYAGGIVIGGEDNLSQTFGLNAVLWSSTDALPTRRVTNSIRMHTLDIKFRLLRAQNVTHGGSQQDDACSIRAVVICDKVPAVVGSPPDIMSADGSPGPNPTPGIAQPNCVFSRLGRQAGSANMMLVRNPQNRVFVDVLHDEIISRGGADKGVGVLTSVLGVPVNNYIPNNVSSYHHIRIPLHGRAALWNQSTVPLQTMPVLNSIWLVLWSDMELSPTLADLTPVVIGLSWSVEFDDVQYG